ncbi:MAG: hypothetical protein RQ758_05920 [Methanomicrobiaceae archaeon]|nr:hypothetical protein [Methanomicrobiaceae archaeon]
MPHRSPHPVLLLLCLSLLAVSAGGHVPLTATGGESLSDAVLIGDPQKSWVVYDAIEDGGGVRYFRVEMGEGEELRLSLFVPEQSSFTPDLLVISPGDGGDLAPVPVPEGYIAVLITGSYPEEPDFEPFTPSVLYPLAEYSRAIERPGTWYIAVREPANEGKFGLAVGFREEFSPAEWLGVPFSVIAIHLWEGQSPLLIIAPFFAVILAALLILQRSGTLKLLGSSRPAMLGLAAGLLCLGSAGITGFQMAFALWRTGWSVSAVVTTLFVLVPALLGIAMITASRKYLLAPSRIPGIQMGIWGILALLFWAGYGAGPLLAFVSAALFLARRV